MAVKYVDFAVSGDPVTARATAETALTDRRFRIAWTDEWSGIAERGNKVANVIFGAFAQHFRVGVRVMSDSSGVTVVRIERLTSGWAGGAVGAARTSGNMTDLKSELEAIFTQTGVLQGVREA